MLVPRFHDALMLPTEETAAESMPPGGASTTTSPLLESAPRVTSTSPEKTRNESGTTLLDALLKRTTEAELAVGGRMSQLNSRNSPAKLLLVANTLEWNERSTSSGLDETCPMVP